MGCWTDCANIRTCKKDEEYMCPAHPACACKMSEESSRKFGADLNTPIPFQQSEQLQTIPVTTFGMPRTFTGVGAELRRRLPWDGHVKGDPPQLLRALASCSVCIEGKAGGRLLIGLPSICLQRVPLTSHMKLMTYHRCQTRRNLLLLKIDTLMKQTSIMVGPPPATQKLHVIGHSKGSPQLSETPVHSQCTYWK